MPIYADASELLDEDPSFPETETGQRRKLDFLGFAPCPIRGEMRRRLHRLFRASRIEEAGEPVWYVPAGCHEPTVYDDLWQTQDETDLPGLIAEAGIGGFNHPEFVRRWLDQGFFQPYPNELVRPEFHDAGLVDAQGLHLVYAVLPEIILVDMKRLGARAVPRTWGDLLNPQYRGDIIIGGDEGKLRESFLFGFGRDFGESGLNALGANIRGFMHPSAMAKAAGSDNPAGAALYVLPQFFALGAPRREAVRIVWPEEGAYSMPCYLMRTHRARPVTSVASNFLLGPEWAAHLARVGFAPGRKGSPALPGKLRWLGWDYVRQHDVDALRAPLNAAFAAGYRREVPAL